MRATFSPQSWSFKTKSLLFCPEVVFCKFGLPEERTDESRVCPLQALVPGHWPAKGTLGFKRKEREMV